MLSPDKRPLEELPLPDQVWRASSLGASPKPCVPSGFPALDAELPGGGWPTHALSEILCARPGALEWRLLGPGLLGLGAHAGRPLLLINPPLRPHLPGLQAYGLAAAQWVWIAPQTPQQQLWAAEEAIKSNAAAAVLAWLPQARPEQIRRLQTHALAMEAPVFIVRPQQLQSQTSAAPLRLLLEAEAWTLQLRILKRRGPVLESPLQLEALPGDLARVLTPRMRLRPAPTPILEPQAHALARPASSALAQ